MFEHFIHTVPHKWAPELKTEWDRERGRVREWEIERKNEQEKEQTELRATLIWHKAFN